MESAQFRWLMVWVLIVTLIAAAFVLLDLFSAERWAALIQGLGAIVAGVTLP